MLKAIPRQSSTKPKTVADRPRRLYGWGARLYGIIRNHSGFSPFVRVMVWPPTKNIEPMVVMK